MIAVNTSGSITSTANLVYAGDLQGNLWRVDVSNANPALWAATVLFQARDASGNMQPITTKPIATLNPRFPQVLGTLVMFGTGQYLGVPDIANGKVQSIYGVYDPPAGYTSALTRSSLLQQTLATAMLGTQQVRTISGTAPTFPANKGWYMDLSLLSGERVINDPRLFAGGELILTTFQPIVPLPGACTIAGSSYLMVLNFATGGSFTTPQFDANGDGHDQLIGYGGSDRGGPAGPPGGPVAGKCLCVRRNVAFWRSLEQAAPASPSSQRTALAVAPVLPARPSSAARILTSMQLVGAPKSRTAWWEIRQ